MATTREGSPNVLMEALACGLPCVATPVGGIPDVLSERGGVLSPATPRDMANAITSVLSRRWNRSDVRAVAACRGWDDVASECCDALRAAVAMTRAHT